MRNKVVDVVPYIHTYRAYNKFTGETSGDFARIEDAYAYILAQPKRHYLQPPVGFTLKIEREGISRVLIGYDYSDTDRRWTRGLGRSICKYEYFPQADWVILNDLGVLVTEGELKTARRNSRTPRKSDSQIRYELRGTRLTRKKGSGEKIKLSCARVADNSYWGYDTVARKYYRNPSTIQERRINESHIEEYGEEFVRGRRRILPSSWDDISVSLWKTEDSWKHHSKRRKQWKPK